MTNHNRPAASQSPATPVRRAGEPAFQSQLEPRPFRRRPWLLALAALALAAWMTFLLLMAWQPWEAKKRPPPLREKEAAQGATDGK